MKVRSAAYRLRRGRRATNTAILPSPRELEEKRRDGIPPQLQNNGSIMALAKKEGKTPSRPFVDLQISAGGGRGGKKKKEDFHYLCIANACPEREEEKGGGGGVDF